MHITSSDLQLQSSHTRAEHTVEQERLRVQADGVLVDFERSEESGSLQRDQVVLSETAQAMSEVAPAQEGEDPTEIELGPEEKAQALVLETMLGVAAYQRARAALRVGQRVQQSHGRPAPQSTPAQEGERAGWGLAYDFVREHHEAEQTSFSAQGTVQTADGRTLDIAVEMERDRVEVSREELHVRAGDPIDPLVLQLGDRPVSLSDQTTAFDLDADGQTEAMPLLDPGAAYLAMDRDGSGTIESGAELFGPSTGSGWSELAELDSDGNRWIDEADESWSELSLWRPGEEGTTSLSAAQVGAIYLGHASTPFDLQGDEGQALGQMASSGIYLSESGEPGLVHQIDAVV